MTKYVPDISSRRWVIVAPTRNRRPDTNGKKHSKKDPFAKGHENDAPDEVFRIGKGDKNEPGWKVRVVSNKFPITDMHEVIVHSPDKSKHLEDLTKEEVIYVLQAYRDRFNFYRSKGQVLIFCNRGEFAGASIEHPHSQLVVIPPQINLDSLTREPQNNIVHEDKHFSVYCPDFSQWPYELWINPKKEKTLFGDITDDELSELSAIVEKMLKRLQKIYHNGSYRLPFGYNYYISPKENWYFRIIPRFIHRAGFELGTGLSVNIVDPTDAALAYRGMDERTSQVLAKLKTKF